MAQVKRKVGGVLVDTRSRVTNGKMHAGIDERSTYARRFRDLVLALLKPFKEPDEATRSLARSIAGLTCRREAFEELIASGQPINDDVYVRMTGVLSRLQDKLSDLATEASTPAKRRAPTLDEVIARYCTEGTPEPAARQAAQAQQAPITTPQTNTIEQQQPDEDDG